MRKPNPLLAAIAQADPEPQPQAAIEAPVAKAKAAPSRVGQKHLGAYFDKSDPILERVAILRTRLDMNNSELIEHALNELWKRHEAGRAFGD